MQYVCIIFSLCLCFNLIYKDLTDLLISTEQQIRNNVLWKVPT